MGHKYSQAAFKQQIDTINQNTRTKSKHRYVKEPVAITKTQEPKSQQEFKYDKSDFPALSK